MNQYNVFLFFFINWKQMDWFSFLTVVGSLLNPLGGQSSEMGERRAPLGRG